MRRFVVAASAGGGVDRASVGDPGHLTPPRVTDSSEHAPSAPPAEEQRRCAGGAV